jgi:hypothetical protein
MQLRDLISEDASYFGYGDVEVCLGPHILTQASKRFAEGKFTVKDATEKLFKRGSELCKERRPHLHKSPPKEKHKGYEVLIFSVSLNQGIVATFKQSHEFRNPRDYNVMFITWLPYGKKTPKPGTELIIVEGKQFEVETILVP